MVIDVVDNMQTQSTKEECWGTSRGGRGDAVKAEAALLWR